MGRARRAIRALMSLHEALVRQDGQEVTVPAHTLRVGDLVIVRPAERLPADGVVAHGRSSVDQSPITGESIPVDGTVGSPVFAGTINQRGSLDIRVTKNPKGASLTGSARVHAAGVILGSGATYAVLAGHGLQGAAAFYKAITLLVVASRCAVVISTPVTVLSAIANAARRGRSSRAARISRGWPASIPSCSTRPAR